ncbi:MAG: hypothetical protein GYA61_04505 [Spirochaetales bacterium]|nr:hypothetical protein [Spirochaetales bacterium]
MPYCYNCGVKLDDLADTCPLCGAKIPIKKDSINKLGKEKLDENNIIKEDERFNDKEIVNLKNNKNISDFLYPAYESSSEKQRITSILEIISVSFIISILSIVLINFILEGKITWSKIPAFSIFFAWLIIASILVFNRKIFFSLLFIFLSIFGYLVSLDSLNKKIDWSINYALPILAFCVAVFTILFFISKKTKLKGLNLFAYYLLGGCLICFEIDIIININTMGHIFISWSKYVSFAVVPISLFLLYIHHRFATKLPGKRTFRI